MDINYLLRREQIERVRADRAGCDRSRTAHSEMADGYRLLVESYRERVVAAFSPPALGRLAR